MCICMQDIDFDSIIKEVFTSSYVHMHIWHRLWFYTRLLCISNFLYWFRCYWRPYALRLFSWDRQINDRAVPVEAEIPKGAILVQIAPLWISQPNDQNQPNKKSRFSSMNWKSNVMCIWACNVVCTASAKSEIWVCVLVCVACMPTLYSENIHTLDDSLLYDTLHHILRPSHTPYLVI